LQGQSCSRTTTLDNTLLTRPVHLPNLPKLLYKRNAHILIVVNSYLLIARNRWISLQVIQRLKAHRRMRGSEHGIWQIACMWHVMHAKVEPKDATYYKQKD
jgi:hypothetical protein